MLNEILTNYIEVAEGLHSENRELKALINSLIGRIDELEDREAELIDHIDDLETALILKEDYIDELEEELDDIVKEMAYNYHLEEKAWKEWQKLKKEIL